MLSRLVAKLLKASWDCKATPPKSGSIHIEKKFVKELIVVILQAINNSSSKYK